MIREYGDAVQAQAKAAADRDPAALLAAGQRVVAWVVATEGSAGPLYLYRDARRAGIAVTVPRKCGF